MIFLPWIVFVVGIAFITWKGFASKREYLLEQSQNEEKAKAAKTQESEKQSPRQTSPTAA